MGGLLRRTVTAPFFRRATRARRIGYIVRMGQRRDRRRLLRKQPARAERLARLVADLVADPGYGLGEKRFPRPVADEDAAAVAEALHAELEGGLAVRAEQAAGRGLPLACTRGCNACCEELVIVERPEALAVARWLGSEAGASARTAFLAGYPRWREAVGDAPERIAALSADPSRRDEYEAAHREQWRKRVLCAFNVGGDCAIYPVRPLLCREAHAVETADRCAGGSPVPARRLTFGPVDDFMSRAAFLLRAAHRALTDRPAEALCAAVHRLLGE